MDASLAVSVNSVSKKYKLFSSLQERFKEALHPFDKKYHHEFWALKGIDFNLPKGTALGIIGRNGSGKSTLLQVICSILRPTMGTIEVEGRISALLELGAGLNPQFTGRENASLAGYLLGYTSNQVK